MIRILIITSDLGRSAGGRVSENIVNGLAGQGHDIEVFASENYSNSNLRYKVIEVPFRYTLPDRLAKLLNIVFLSSFKYKFWEFEVFNYHIGHLKKFNPDIVFALGSGGNESVLNLGLRISNKLKKPFAIHLPDPIPGPKGWENYEIYRRSRVFTIKKALKSADLISMGNSHMLEFQQRNLNFDIREKSFVLPDPAGKQRFNLGPPSPKNIIAYLGNFYGARKPDSLLHGFAEYHKKDPEAELQIYGDNKLKINDLDLPRSVMSRIHLKSWTSYVRSVYEEASVLVDVDADIPEDVFISSKLKGYLQQNRMIVLISNPNSPSRKLLESVKESVVFTDHNYNNVSKAIETAFERKNNKNIIKDREIVLNYLDIDRIAVDVSARLEKVVKVKTCS